MASAQMKCVARFGHKHHPIDTKKYGQPLVALYYADRVGFVHPGLHLWLWNKNYWVLPLPRRR